MGRLNLKSLQKRTLSAAVLIPLTLLAVYMGGPLFYLLVFALSVISLYEWNMMAAKTEKRGASIALGALYVLGGFVFCLLIREKLDLGPSVIFLLMVWGADIGAYFTGKIIGGPKMAPSISPNKTWAGLAGGCVFAGLLAALYVLAFGGAAQPAILALGVVIALAGQGGDLLVSQMKRTVGVKNTGDIIPGHGGVLDRIDSMLLAAPVFYGLFSVLGIQI